MAEVGAKNNGADLSLDKSVNGVSETNADTKNNDVKEAYLTGTYIVTRPIPPLKEY